MVSLLTLFHSYAYFISECSFLEESFPLIVPPCPDCLFLQVGAYGLNRASLLGISLNSLLYLLPVDLELSTKAFGLNLNIYFLAPGCAHNPTGIDPTKEQWAEICELCQRKGHLPFFDVAYQGFATGSLEEDAFAPRLFIEKGSEIFVAQSYSKNLGLYAERVGALNFVGKDSEVRIQVCFQSAH